MTGEDIERAMKVFPCPFCHAKPGQECHSTNQPRRRAFVHTGRGAELWAMWHKGYRAGYERARAEQESRAQDDG